MPRHSRSPLIPFLPLFLFLWLVSPPPATAQISPDSIQVYGTGQRATFTVAVPTFTMSGDTATEGPDLAKLIESDLTLSGFFSPPENPGFARETDLLDRRENSVHFAEWHRIGVLFLVRGEIEVTGDTWAATVQTYDTVSRIPVFRMRYEYPRQRAREMAHHISDDIIERVLHERGNARTRILYVRQLDPYGKTKQVCVMDSDGQNISVLTGAGELAVTPAWGARGTEIYYTTYKHFNPDLSGMILQTRESWWISRKGGFNLSPAWNEARQLIALTLTKDNNSELYTLRRTGENLTRLTRNRAIDSSPSFSPDGNQLAFQSDRTGSPQIWILDLRTNEERRLTYHSNYNDAPSWSPEDPDRIAFCSRVDGRFHIFTCRPDGTDLLKITSGSHNNEDPSWAPNGRELVFTSDRTGRKQIYRVYSDGSNLHQLTRDSDCQSPAWSPFSN